MKSFLNGIPEEAKKGLTTIDIQNLLRGREVTPATWNEINKDQNFKMRLLQSNENWVRDGKDPVGYVWNHNENGGIMQLINRKIHAIPHTGGRTVWGGGGYYR